MTAPPALPAVSGAAWPLAARLVARWLERRERLDFLLEHIPAGTAPSERVRCQHLVYGVVRHFGRLDAGVARRVEREPRFATRAALLVAGFELLEAQAGALEDGKVARIVHHAVEQTKRLASPAEARLVNAVARRLAGAFSPTPPGATAPLAERAEFFSHPEWVVARWETQFGAAAAGQLLQWNQEAAVVHARWRDPATPVSDFLRPTPWPGFYEVAGGHWPELARALEAGRIYLQDPATRLAVELLAPQPGESVLDLCAAPGGKSVLIADGLAAGRRPDGPPPAGRIVAVDLPGTRLGRLKENLARIAGLEVALVQADLMGNLPALLRDAHGLPESYPAVLLDAPCSNSGVMRHRPDVKWRWAPGDFATHAQQQVAMLHAAARLVAPGGRLVYSTCSLDAAENEEVVRTFFASRAGSPFQLERSVQSLPWRDRHDGAGAFLLRRQG